MNLKLTILTAWSLLVLACTPPVTTKTVDVLVVGGTTSGTSAAIQSARMGAATLVVEETPWLGGMMTAAGVSAIDGNHNLPSGIWNEFREKLRQHYGGAAALATGWVSHTQFEPHVGDSIFKAMAAAEAKLEVIHGFYPVSLIKEGNKVTGAIFQNDKKEELKVQAHVVIDATDLGDGLAMAGADYDLGMEAAAETGEAMAPEVANSIVQDLTWAAILKDYGPDADKTIPKPEGYDPELFKGSCAMTVDSVLIDCDKMLTYGKLPNNKYMINWPRHGNDIYLNVVEMGRQERAAELQKAKLRTLQFVYYIQSELGYKHIGLADDEFPTADALALVPYHREGRRLKGVERLTINHVVDIYGGKPLYRTGISVGDYPVDHHHAYNPNAPAIHFPAVPSFNIPLGTLIPETIDGLIVSDKAISVSNIINGSTRLQPVVLLTGQAAGTLAAMSAATGKNPREIAVRDVQQKLLDFGAYIMPLFDVQPADADFQSIQRIAATGMLQVKGEPYKWANRTWFYPDSTLTKSQFANGMTLIGQTIEMEAGEEPLTYDAAFQYLSKIVSRDISGEAKQLMVSRKGDSFSATSAITRRDMAILFDHYLDPFHTKPIGFDGHFLVK